MPPTAIGHVPNPPLDAPVSQAKAPSVSHSTPYAASCPHSRAGSWPFTSSLGVNIHSAAYATRPSPSTTVSSTKARRSTTGSRRNWAAAPWATPATTRPDTGRIIRGTPRGR